MTIHIRHALIVGSAEQIRNTIFSLFNYSDHVSIHRCVFWFTDVHCLSMSQHWVYEFCLQVPKNCVLSIEWTTISGEALSKDIYLRNLDQLSCPN